MRRSRCNSPPNGCRPREVALAYAWVGDERLETLGGILRPVNDEVHHTGWEARIPEEASDEEVRAWAEFRAL